MSIVLKPENITVYDIEYTDKYGYHFGSATIEDEKIYKIWPSGQIVDKTNVINIS
jgi:hypothetical protein